MLLKGMEFDTTHFITNVSGKYPRLWALKGAHPVTVNRWYKFGALASIRTIAPSFREISELPDWLAESYKKSVPPRRKKRPATALTDGSFGHIRKKRKRASCGRSSTKKREASTNGRPQFTGKMIEYAPSLLCYKKEAQSSEEGIENQRIKNSETHLSHSSSPLYYRVKIRAFVIVFKVYVRRVYSYYE
ncbi:hypothetical protein ACS0TY_008063 [Phlomoides rotata]